MWSLRQWGRETHHLGLYHVAYSLIEGVHVMGLEITDDGPDVVQDLFNEWHHLHGLNLMAHIR